MMMQTRWDIDPVISVNSQSVIDSDFDGRGPVGSGSKIAPKTTKNRIKIYVRPCTVDSNNLTFEQTVRIGVGVCDIPPRQKMRELREGQYEEEHTRHQQQQILLDMMRQ